MHSAPASVSLVPAPSRVDACGLCSTGPEILRNAAIVRNASGAALELIACDRCSAAVRRLIAAAGSAAPAGPRQMTLAAERGSVQATVDASTWDTVGEAVVVHEFVEPFVGDDQVTYSVRVLGQPRSDGTWIGWLSFAAIGGAPGGTRTTARETSQSSREHLAYWATGLQLSYLEGAFRRASEAPGLTDKSRNPG